jgi:hypothetical protein
MTITIATGMVITNTLAILTLVTQHAPLVDTFVTHTVTFDHILEADEIVSRRAARHPRGPDAVAGGLRVA